MKLSNKKSNLFWYLIVALGMSGCTKADLITYDMADSIYFKWTDGEETQYIGSLDYSNSFDSLNVSFAWKPASLQDTVIAIPVIATGSPSTRNRNYKVVALAASTAVAGVHYVPLADNFVFRKGLVQDTIFVHFFRSADLRETKKTLILKLEETDDFKLNITHSIVSAYDLEIHALDPTRFRINIDDIQNEPPGWNSFYFGEFSEKKLKLCLEVLNLPDDFFSVSDPDIRWLLNYYSDAFEAYLVEQKANGNTVYEEDGSEMTRGW